MKNTAADKSKRSSWPSRLAYGLYLVVVCLILLELGFRLLQYREYRHSQYDLQSLPTFFLQPDSLMGFALRPGGFEVRINEGLTFFPRHNETGIRSWDLPSETGPEIILLGCSYSYGWGLADSQCYGRLVQQALPGYHLKNLAVPGIGLSQFYLQVQELLEQDSLPQAIVLNYCSFHEDRAVLSPQYRKDLAMGFARAQGEAELKQFDRFRYPYAVMENEQLQIRYCFWQDLHQNWPLREYSALMNHLQTSWEAWDLSNWQKTKISQALILDMQQRCQAKGVTFVLTGLTQDEKTDQMLRWANERSIPVVDMSLPLQDPTYHNAPFDTHPNAKAHAHFARKLSAYFQQKP